MNLTIEPFKAAHVLELQVQAAQEDQINMVTQAELRPYESTNAWTTRVDGRVILIGGLVTVWHGRGMLWSYIAQDAGPYMMRVTRGVRRFIEDAEYQRVELYVDRKFKPGHRWAKLLGFRLEAARMRSFFPNGGDASLYARSK